MARRGWVSAEVAPDTWKRLVVFDDGWVEVSGFARGLSDTRAQLRRLLRLVLAVVLLVGVAPWLLGLVGAPGPLGTVLQLVGLLVGVWAVIALRVATMSADADQAAGDLAQARRERDAGDRARVAPGARAWRRTSSAQEMAASLTNVRLVAAESVLGVSATLEDGVHVVTVRLADGAERTLRSPDRTLPRLVLPFAR